VYSDERIMDRVKQGNLSELSLLFERYHKKLYNFFLRLTHDRANSHDLTQNLFYRILKYRNSYKTGQCFKTWMYQMARNIFFDYHKQQKQTTDRLQFIEVLDGNNSDQLSTFDEEEYERLDQALMKLPPNQREIIVLSRYQGLNYEEISQINSSSVAAIKVQVHRAIKQLRDIYFEQE
jgi:RNA polymerase sigma factor (sigma-70 family)